MSNTTFIHFLFIIISSVRSLLCCYMITILLTLVIIIRLRYIIRCIMLFKIIIGWFWCFTRFPITYCFPITKRYASGNYIFPTIGKKVLLIAGLIPMISTSSSSTGDFSMKSNIFGIVWYIVKYIFLFSLWFDILKTNFSYNW